MRLLILGATGRTGRQLVAQALEQGHEVTALVRDGASLEVRHPRLQVRVGAATSSDAVDAALEGQDAVLSALGSRRARELLGTDLMRTSMRTLSDAMPRRGVRRVVLLSALGAGRSARRAPRLLRLAFRTMLRRIGQDKAASEALLRESDLDWTVVYPPALTDGPLTARYRYGADLQVCGMPKLSRADVAHLMLASLRDESTTRASIMVTSAAR